MSRAEEATRGGREASQEARGNVQRAADIFDKHSHFIRAVIGFFVKAESDIDDIYQNLFLSLVRRPIPTNMQDTELRRYLYRAIRNDVLDASRQAKNRKVQIEKYAQWRICCARSEEQEGPEVTVARAEEVQKIFKIIEDQLPSHEGEAIVHRYHHDRPICDAARIMCVKQRSFSRYLCVGLKRARDFFNTVEDDLV